MTIRKLLTSIPLLLYPACLQPAIVYETGSLREFIGGNSPSTAYDNYVSHVSEGIVSPGYNDYGPEWLDIQTNGFGNYRMIEAASGTLTYWRTIFQELLEHDLNTVDQMLVDSLPSFRYDLVVFSDTTTSQIYYMLRERLDSTYVDSSLSDTVWGSFHNGWGLFILSPNASRRQLVIEVPHPCDDFIAPYLGLELFRQCSGRAYLLAGAGREVRWSGTGNYTNNKSLSDPSRNANTLFQVFHEVLADTLVNEGPHSPLVLHTHSFDNLAHAGLRSIILSAGAQESFANKPIRDITADHLDFVNFTSEIPVPENTFGDHPAVLIPDYYQVHYSGEFYYYGQSNTYPIPQATSLLGPVQGVQMVYLNQLFNSWSVYQPWVQIEFDEKPELFDTMDMPLTELYAGNYPTSYHNFSILLDYYQPFIAAVEAYLANWEAVPDTTAPALITPFYPSETGPNHIRLHWAPVEDTNFRTYRIYYGSDTAGVDSGFWDRHQDPYLEDMRRNYTTLTGLLPGEQYTFRIQAEDHFGNTGLLSAPAFNFIPGHAPAVIVEDFEAGSLQLDSYPGEDADPGAWTLDTTNTDNNSGYALHLFGNTWKMQALPGIGLEANSVWSVAGFSAAPSEIQGIGFQDSSHVLWYSFYGTEQLDIEQWVTVYQGTFPPQEWNQFLLPVGRDWLARYEYLPLITAMVYVNDNDGNTPGSIFFDSIGDETPDLSIAPRPVIDYSTGNPYRNTGGQRNVDVQFTSTIHDSDSYIHQVSWDFGDGTTSPEPHPQHTYNITDNHPYTVHLEVIDETGLRGHAAAWIDVDPGPSTLPLRLNFVGDIMLARRYEASGGIISEHGVEAIFSPTLPLLGEAADITIANLECPLTDGGAPHPTKSIVFRGSPANVDGLVYAGIDVVTLANNHTLDYGLTGLQQTQSNLQDNAIAFSGAGANSYEAYLPVFINRSGINIAFLASSDRTGQYNNAQPYLNAGYNKPGFAYLTPFYLDQQIKAVRDIADVVVVEMHAGSEYSTAPGSDYDLSDPLFPGFNNSTGNGYRSGPPEDLIDTGGDEGYLPDLDIPHMWDREIRHFAIDSGADLVVVHHPHRIQGLEVYQGKLIAHSLGNFVFDLDYPETYPSIILAAEVTEAGFSAYAVTPVYIDDYIPVPARGELGLYILDYLAGRSRELDTYLHVDRENILGRVHLDTLGMERVTIICRQEVIARPRNGIWRTAPMRLPRHGSFASILNLPDMSNWQYRLGRERIWFGNFEEEGATPWNLNSSDEWMDTLAYAGSRALAQRRQAGDVIPVVTDLEDRMQINADRQHTLQGFIRTTNAQSATLEIRYYSSRNAPVPLETGGLGSAVSGTTAWTGYHQDLTPPANARYFDFRLRSGIPADNIGLAWFDNVGLLEWSDWEPVNPQAGFRTPHDYYYLQLKSTLPVDTSVIIFTENLYGPAAPVTPDFHAPERIGQVPFTVSFHDLSGGTIAWWFWYFGDGRSSINQDPVHTYTSPGLYTVSLTVLDYDGSPLSIQKEAYIIVLDSEPHARGDINGDGILNQMDLLLCVNIILGRMTPSPVQFYAADVNFDRAVDILDLLTISDLVIPIRSLQKHLPREIRPSKSNQHQ